jgi:hypothetical protein
MPDVAAAAGTPVAFYPVGALKGRALVTAGDPNVAVAVPAVVAGVPGPTGAGGDGDDLDGTRGWGADADDDLGARGERRRQKDGTCECG